MAVGFARSALANGDEFFGGVEIVGQTELVYFGSVKDRDGNYLEGVEVTLTCSDPSLTYVTYTDVIGRYRTADVGRGMIELGYRVDPTKLDIRVAREGYTQVRRLNRSPYLADRGAFEITFTMEKTTGDGPSAEAQRRPNSPG